MSKPEWLKKQWRPSADMARVEELVRGLGLNTVCREASCPNYCDCFSRGTATFLILGAVCTRECGFCGVTHATPEPACQGDGTFYHRDVYHGDGTFDRPLDQGEAMRVAGAVSQGDGTFYHRDGTFDRPPEPACQGDGGSPVAPEPVDQSEAMRVAEAVKALGLSYVVITSVTRDDLEDGGASEFARTVREIRRLSPETNIETLIPDFKGDEAALDIVLEAAPDVISHNIETVRGLYDKVRPQADYDRSLKLLRRISDHKGTQGDGTTEAIQKKRIKCKSGLMVGVGETYEQVCETIDDLGKAGCTILTIGQYLRPSQDNIPVEEFIKPEIFERWAEYARGIGF